MSVRGRLIGREPALEVLRAAMRAARGGWGRLVFVSGEPGIGKSALLAEAADEATDLGARVLWGQCWEGDGAPAYWPWIQVVRAAAASGAVIPDDVAPLLPPVEEAPRTDGDTEHLRFRLFDATVRYLAATAGDHGLVLALDDLQWADEPSLRLLEFAARHLRTSPVCILGAYRDTEAAGALRRVVTVGQHLALSALPRDAVRALIAAIAGEDPTDTITDDVWRRTGGNPFFVVELTRLLLAGGGLDRRPAPPTRMLDSVRDTLERRLARLSQPCADLLALAAVAGTAVRPEVLARVREDVADLLAEATAANVLVEPAGPLEAHRFAHDLFRETVLSGLGPSTRATLHLAVGRALEALRTEGAMIHAAELAGHFAAAAAVGGAAAAVRYSTLAAEEATAQLAFEDACAHYERALHALDLVDEPVPTARLDLLLALAAARAGAGRPEARATYLRAADVARRLGDGARLARAALGVHGLGARSGTSFAEHIALLREATEAVHDDRALAARVVAGLARELRHSHDPTNVEQAPKVAEQAVTLARTAGDPAAVAFCLLASHDVQWGRGTAADRLAVIDEMLAVAADAGDRTLRAQARLLRATALLELGDPQGRADLQEYCRLADESGHARGRWGALSRRATLALIAGRADEADELSTAAHRLGEQIGEPDAHGVRGTQQVALALLGHPAGADPETLPSQALLPAGRALEHALAGDIATARAALAGLTLDELPETHDLETPTIAAAAIAVAGSGAQREEAYRQLLPHEGSHIVVGGCAAYYGAVDHHLGVLASALDGNDRAAAHLEAAAAMHDRLGAVAWAKLSRAHLAGTARADASVEPAPANTFRRDADVWTLTYAGTSVHLPDSKGLRDIAVLLASPGQPVHVLQLVGAPGAQVGADPVLDDRARASYRARLAEIEAEVDEADAHHDPVRAERAREERDALVAELSAATGLGGRQRRLGDTTERARKAVTARIRDALGRIERRHPVLGEHLRAAIATGTSCTYAPPAPTTWAL